MSSETINKCMFLGLPGSGKSSFIGALWHVVETGEIDTAYSVKTLPEDREYLNALRDRFLTCKAPERTKTEFLKQIKLSIQDNDTGKEVGFIFPDLSGETFTSQFEYRKISEDYILEMQESNALMLFINPAHLKKANLISDLNGMFEDEPESDNHISEMELKNDMPTEPSEKFNVETEDLVEITTNKGIAWTAKMSQTQVKIIDLLQMIQKLVVKPCRICVVISAWDLITSLPDYQISNVSPNKWLLQELPLLYQFLVANKSTFLFQTFGISAQGGRYKTKDSTSDDTQILQDLFNQSERIKVQLGHVMSNDITLPVKWLLNGE